MDIDGVPFARNGMILGPGQRELQQAVVAMRSGVQSGGSSAIQASGSSGSIAIPDGRPMEWMVGKVVYSGPSGEADYTDKRYWVRSVYCNASDGTKTTAATFATYATTSDGHRWVTATNIAEIAGNVQDHSIPENEIVFCVAVGDSSGSVLRRWLIVGGHLGLAEC
jgi:hypothetical protein